MPVQELPLPGEYAGRVPPRTMRFRFEAPFKLADQPEAADSIRKQLRSQLRHCTAPIISFPQLDEPFESVDITFGYKGEFVVAVYEASLSLRFKGYHLSEWKSGAELEPFEVPIVIEQKDAIPGVSPLASKEVLGKLARACNEQLAPQGHIIEGWAQYESPVGQPHLGEWTGKLICLFELLPGRSLPSSLQLGQSRLSVSH